MTRVVWYFDFISPYAYLSLHTLGALPREVTLEYRPVLFAGLLSHWGQKGPAEIPPKRLWTYRSCVWLAQRQRLPFRLPAAHPFNSLPYLRLALAAGATPRAVHAIFDALWTSGADPAAADVLAGLAETLGIEPGQLAEPAVKDQLRANTEQAAREGVFGVPSFRVAGEVFWGSDALDFLLAYLGEPGVLATSQMQRAASLPIGVARAGSA